MVVVCGGFAVGRFFVEDGKATAMFDGAVLVDNFVTVKGGCCDVRCGG